MHTIAQLAATGAGIGRSNASHLTLETLRSQLNSHLLPLFIYHRSSGEKLIKNQANSYFVIMSVILMTTLFYKALIVHNTRRNLTLITLKV